MKFSKMAEYNFSNDAAAVLRDYVRMRSEIAELRRRLKVAEDALTECRGFAERYEMDDDYMQSDICSDIRGTVRNAIAAIRGDKRLQVKKEGGKDGECKQQEND